MTHRPQVQVKLHRLLAAVHRTHQRLLRDPHRHRLATRRRQLPRIKRVRTILHRQQMQKRRTLIKRPHLHPHPLDPQPQRHRPTAMPLHQRQPPRRHRERMQIIPDASLPIDLRRKSIEVPQILPPRIPRPRIQQPQFNQFPFRFNGRRRFKFHVSSFRLFVVRRSLFTLQRAQRFPSSSEISESAVRASEIRPLTSDL